MDDERASELTLRLAELEGAPGDPHIFAREPALREHPYRVLDQCTPRRRIQRGVNVASSGRLFGEIRLQRRRQTLLEIGDDDDADLAEV